MTIVTVVQAGTRQIDREGFGFMNIIISIGPLVLGGLTLLAFLARWADDVRARKVASSKVQAKSSDAAPAVQLGGGRDVSAQTKGDEVPVLSVSDVEDAAHGCS